MIRRVHWLLPALVVGILAGCGKTQDAPAPDAAATPEPSEPANLPTAAAGCPYLPEFVALQAELPKLSPADVSDRLTQYASQYVNPEGCEGAEIERLLTEAESQLFHLAYADTRPAAQLVFRCDEWDPKTTRCQGPVEDGTANPSNIGLTALKMPTSDLKLESDMKNAKLLGVYVLALADALDGKPARKLSDGSTFALPAGSKDVAVVAVYQVDGTWKYRKAVWYF